LCFWVSDGSIPLLRARNNILHFQFPFKDVGGKNMLNRMKFMRINSVVCNSKFTKKFIDKEYGVKSKVIYPPVDTKSFKPGKKEKLIIYIGRFSQLTQNKGQDVLVEVFKKFYDEGYKDWKLVLAGGVEIGVDDYVENLRKESEGYPIEILESPEFKVIKSLYSKATLFWSAAGFGVDESKEPTRVEHFGIALVEAMAAGCVPVAFSAGGPKEIISSGKNGVLWKKRKELLEITEKYSGNSRLLKSVSKEAVARSKVFSYKSFGDDFAKIL
jgi:glycosyltransferase involved in cell wall biosynthesis